MNKSLIENQIKIITSRGTLGGILCGMGLYHALNNQDNLLEVPLAIIFPSAYAGYHGLKYFSKMKIPIDF